MVDQADIRALFKVDPNFPRPNIIEKGHWKLDDRGLSVAVRMADQMTAGDITADREATAKLIDASLGNQDAKTQNEYTERLIEVSGETYRELLFLESANRMRDEIKKKYLADRIEQVHWELWMLGLHPNAEKL